MMDSATYRRRLLWFQIAFWIGYFLFYFLNNLRYTTSERATTSAAMFTAFFAAIIYINVLWLMPWFFLRKQYMRYTLLALGVIFGLGYLRMLIGYYVFPQPPDSTAEDYWFEVLYFMGNGAINLVLSIPVKYAFDYNRLQAQQQQMANAQLEAEMKLLKMQLHPHFMFNTLNNLYYLTQIKSDDAEQVVEKLSDLMRYMLEKSEAKQVSLRDEISFMQAYMDLEKIRVPHLQMNVTIDGKVDEVMVPPLLGLPLLENAFKHGVDKNSVANQIDVELSVAGGQLMIVVTNPLRAFKKPGNGLGLSNLRKRLMLLYGNDFTLITAEETKLNRYFAKLVIPIVENPKAA